MRKSITLLGCILLLSIGVLHAANTRSVLTRIQLDTQPLITKLKFTYTKKVNYKYFILSKPDRIVLDLPDTKLSTRLPNIVNHSTLIRIRHSYLKSNRLRLVLDLKQPQRVIVQLLHQHPGQQLVLTLHPLTKTSKTSLNKQTQSRLPVLPSTQSLQQHLKKTITQNILTQKQPSLQNIGKYTKPNISKPSRSPKPITIVIDPGHGGHDPGAVSRYGYEKFITLAIAQKLQQQLSIHSTFRVLLTRSQDKFISLRGRLNIARRYRADLFISIHADAFMHSDARGASVFALSLRGASNEAARWLAARGNYSELGGAQLHTQDLLLRSILISLSQKVTIAESLLAGHYILQALKQISPTTRSVVEQAPFVVLKSPDVPSLLIEAGFLSNPTEARELINPHQQQRIAEAIAKGVQLYFKNKATRSL